MKAAVLMDNNAENGLICEWGFSVYIEYNGLKILLDSGSTGDFVKNAQSLGIDLSGVDIALLSHGHYDHANGLDAFFAVNKKAFLFVREGIGENCYNRHSFIPKYNGIKKGILQKYSERIKYVSGDYGVSEGVWLIPHKTENLSEIGKAARLYRRKGIFLYPDDFSHEQSLVIETGKGLAVFSSCSHGGADNIIRETQKAFPEKKICFILGGFHLFRSDDGKVRAFAKRVSDTGVEKIITGHCTGDRAFDILAEELGERAEKFYSGYTLEIRE